MRIHFLFDIVAALAAMAMTAFVYRWRIAGESFDSQRHISTAYLTALVSGAVLGAFGFGTVALRLEGYSGIGRSILGALAGAIVAIELYKHRHGIRESTGIIFVAGFATSTILGRIGCLLAGLDDHTYGVATGRGWGWDFGDGIPRHPVQLYESLTMLVFLGCALAAFHKRQPFFMRHGFYILVAVYSVQRFVWESLKPGAAIVGPLNLFHLLCLLLAGYSAHMMTRRNRTVHAVA